MAFEILGYTLADIREIAPVVGATVVIGGIVYRTGSRLYDKLLNREFDQWVVSVTTVSEPDAQGFRHLILDNLGSPGRFDDEVRGRDERRHMSRVAARCSWHPKQRFLLAGEGDKCGMFHVTRNALTKYWAEGVKAKLAGHPVEEHTFFYAVTGADAAESAKKKYRIVVMNARDMRLVMEHPIDKWRFTDETHRVRLETCRVMAQAWKASGAMETWEEHRHPSVAGSTTVGGETHAIVGWLRAYYPQSLGANPVVA